eukprot:TRINITY_DN26062_c0_g1_i1.p1 TRINITY_DN26062_c0_g1~~TRINITY_DN26062_c0_g1_i1.p1  ORF type:complete len:641 (+),score=124.27 TRINITY_DN26062_c0_g1_i1:40-1923(+)
MSDEDNIIDLDEPQGPAPPSPSRNEGGDPGEEDKEPLFHPGAHLPSPPMPLTWKDHTLRFVVGAVIVFVLCALSIWCFYYYKDHIKSPLELCVEKCSLSDLASPRTPVCVQTSLSKKTLSFAHGTSACLAQCNATVLWPGTCACPNNCSYRMSNPTGTPPGTCTGGKCVCSPPWSGPDCSIPLDCSSPSWGALCSGRGSCAIHPTTHTATCKCNPGYTGTFCNVPAQPLNLNAFGKLFPEEPYSTALDHPIFDMRAVASIYLNVSGEDVGELLAPSRVAKHEVRGSMVFLNDEMNVQLENVGVIGNGGSMLKKEFYFNFGQFVPGQRLGNETQIVLKAGSDETMMKDPLAMSFGYSMNLPFQRVGFCQLWINDVYYGFYIIYEVLNMQWIEARYKTDSPGLMGCNSAPLVYMGDYPSNYSSDKHSVKVGPYEEVFAKMVNLMKVIDIEEDGLFLEELSKIFDINKFLRYMVIEFLTSNPNGYSWSNNNFWLFFDLSSNNVVWIPYNQEDWFSTEIYSDLQKWIEMNSTGWFLDCPPQFCNSHPLSKRLFVLKNAEFRQILTQFVGSVFNTDKLQQVTSTFQNLIAQEISFEYWYGLDKIGEHNSTTLTQIAVPTLQNYLKAKSTTAN